MNKITRILHLEDKRADAELVGLALKQCGIEFELKWVVNKNDFKMALKEFSPDVIISDHSLPSFTSLEALKLVREASLDIPFILVTSSLADEAAAGLMKQGAWDYILKDRMAGLPSAVASALDKYKGLLEKKEAYERMRDSEERYRNMVETAQEGIWTIDENNRTNFVNKKMSEILEYTSQEMMGMEVFDFMDEAGKIIGAAAIELQKKEPSESSEYRFISKTGKEIWANLSTNPIFDGEGAYKGALAMVTDITEKRKMHEKLVHSEKELRNFSRHLNFVQEEERAHLARELHDELSQQLAGLKMGLSLITMLDTKEKMIGGAQDFMKDVDGIIHSMRKIATELRPGILDSLGLIPSLEWLGHEFEIKHKIKCIIKINVKTMHFEKNTSNCLFRICQESLSNVFKHAQATEVKMELEQNQFELIMKIMDNGKGISSEKLENPFSMGLLGMRERAGIIGADLAVTSKPGVGTTILVRAIV